MRKRLSFKNTLVLNLVLVALLPVVLVATMTLNILTGHLKGEIEHENFLLAKSLSGEIGAFINEPKDVLRRLAVMIEAGALKDRELFNASLMSALSNYPVFEMIEVLDEQGRVTAVAPFRKDYIGLNMSGRKFFKKMQKTKDVHWSSASISPHTGEPTLIVSLPLKEGVLAGVLNLRVLTGFIDRLKQGPITISVLDRNGTYIASSVRSRVYERVNVRTKEEIHLALSGIEGTYHTQINGEEVLMCVALIPDTHWPVVVSEPINAAFGPIRRLRDIFWLGIGVAVILALVAAFVLTRRTLKPLSQLILNAKKITKGAYDFKAKPTIYPEIDELQEDFRIMAKTIESRERSLRQSEKTTQALLDLVPDMIFRFNKEGIYTFLKPPVNFPTLVPEDVVGKPMVDLMPPQVVSKRMELVSKRLRKNDAVRHEYALEIGGKIHYREALYVTFDEDQYLAIVRDITGRRAAEAALRENEAKYRTILEDMEEGYFETDLKGNLMFFNESFCTISGMPRDRLNGVNVRQMMDKDNAKKVWQAFNQVFETGKPEREIEVVTRHSDGGMRFLEISAYVLRDAQNQPTGFRGVIRDVTERKRAARERIRLEAQLHQSQKLESLGTLAGGIAHDFNNLLMGIQGRASLMEMNASASDPDMEHLKGIQSYVKSASELTKQLLGFARGGKYEVRPTNINDLIRKSARLFGRTKKEITIHSRFGDDIWTIEVDRGQIEQVLMNLFVNAWQAMPGGGGTLYLDTENVILDETDVHAFNLAPGRFVRISVTDTGVGMDEDTMSRIFDPFFTTKEKERGTGLGLASAYGIIKNHGGIIDVSSKKGVGTSFNIYLPASDASVVQGPVVSGTLLTGEETILLVDDETMIIDVAQELLAGMGYRVLIAEDGAEALEIYKQNRDRIDLVVIDMVMPGMTGGETFDRLKKIDPRVKTILSSGYSIDGEATEILNRGCLGFIQKPFSMNALSRKLREVLDRE